MKAALITGGCNRVGFETGVHLAKKFPKGSVIYLTTKYEAKVAELQESLLANPEVEPEVHEKIKFAHLDLEEAGLSSLIKLKDKIKKEQEVIDVIVNNAEIYLPPALMDDRVFESQCDETLKINYFGAKKVLSAFNQMIMTGGRIVNCSSHLGHLSNLDGREPHASLLRERFTRPDLSEEEIDKLVQEFLALVKIGGGEFWQAGWPACPYTVSKVALNAYTRVLQGKLDRSSKKRDIVVNAVHHGCMDPAMNTSHGFNPSQAGEMVAGLATLPEATTLRGKVMWRDFMTFDTWDYGGMVGGGLDDEQKQSKAFVADYNMKTDMDKLHEVNNGFCLSG